MAGIRIDTGVKRIEVNDNGDYITLSLNDSAFIDRFFGLYKSVQSMADNWDAREAAIREKYKGGDNDAFLEEALALYAEAGGEMMSEVDKLFGPGTCKKVFGDITPSFDLYLEFFEQLTPYLREFAQEKSKRLGKYSAARTGNV